MSLILAILVTTAQPPAPVPMKGHAAILPPRQEAECTTCDVVEGREELQARLDFLERAEAAFLFSHRSTTEVKARIRDVEARLERLDEESEEPPREPASLESRVEAMESTLAFLERAEAAFLHSHRSTTEVKRRIRAARECLETLRGCRPQAGSPVVAAAAV